MRVQRPSCRATSLENGVPEDQGPYLLFVGRSVTVSVLPCLFFNFPFRVSLVEHTHRVLWPYAIGLNIGVIQNRQCFMRSLLGLDRL